VVRTTKTALAILAVVVTLGVLWLGSRPAPVRTATMEDVIAEAEAGGYRLIDMAELSYLYRLPSTRPLMVDTRQEWEFRSGHITGAKLFPMEPTWWERFRSKGRLARLLGPDKDRWIVFYSDGLA
jgi:hypothetical protein